MADEQLKDEAKTCADCKKPFVLTVDEQQWFIERNKTLPDGEKLTMPRRCKPCRKARRDQKRQQGG